MTPLMPLLHLPHRAGLRLCGAPSLPTQVAGTKVRCGVVAVGTRTPSAVLGSHLMSVHLFPQKRPAVSIWPFLLAAATLPATPRGRMETPLDDQGPTLETQAPPVELVGVIRCACSPGGEEASWVSQHPPSSRSPARSGTLKPPENWKQPGVR